LIAAAFIALLLLLVGAAGLLLAAAGTCMYCNSSWALAHEATCPVGAAVAAVGFGAAGAPASHWLQLCMLLLMQATCPCLAGLQSQDSRSRCNDTAGMGAAAAAEQGMAASHMADMAALTRVQWWTAVSVHVSCSAWLALQKGDQCLRQT
jgi:hypothetical protein